MRRKIGIVIVVMWLAACATNSTPLSPAGQVTLQANQVVVALGTLQHTAIELNKVQVCQPMPCHPLLSDTDTGIVVDNVTTALQAIKGVPAGWRTTSVTALQAIQDRMTQNGKTQIAAWLDAARSVITALNQP